MAGLSEIENMYLILDMSSDLSRISRFALEGNEKRVKQFMGIVDEYTEELQKRKLKKKFLPTYTWFIKQYKELKQSMKKLDKYFADDACTLSVILMHRAELA